MKCQVPLDILCKGRHQKQTVLLSRSACWQSRCLRVPKKTRSVCYLSTQCYRPTNPPPSSCEVFTFTSSDLAEGSTLTRPKRSAREEQQNINQALQQPWNEPCVAWVVFFLDVLYTTPLPSFSSGILRCPEQLENSLSQPQSQTLTLVWWLEALWFGG